MKLNRIEKQVRSAQVNVTLPGKLKAELDSYAAYYQQGHGEPIGLRKLIVEADREFQAWTRRNASGHANTNGSATRPSVH